MADCVPTCCAMFRQKLVLPIDGRAATITRSPGLQPGGHLVQFREARGHAGDQALVLLQLLDRLEAVAHEVGHRDEARPERGVGDLEDLPLRAVQQQLGILLAAVRVAEDAVRDEDQPPPRRLLLDDSRVLLDVGRTGHAVGQGGDVRRPADLVELPGPPQFLVEDHEVDRLAALAERDHLVEDDAMGRPEEVVRRDHLHRLVDRLVADEDRAQHRAFGLEAVRERAFGDFCVGHARWSLREASRLRAEEGILPGGTPRVQRKGGATPD